MTTNISELRRFYEVWGPMITSLPAVINATENASELQAHVVRLREEVTAAQTATARALEERKAGFAAIEAQLQELTNKKREHTLTAKAHEKACAERVAEATAKADAAVAEQEARALASIAATRKFEADIANQVASAEAQFEADKADKLQAIADLEAKRASAEQALSELRAKLS